MREKHASRPSTSDISCHLCASPTVDLIEGYEAFRRVTSDCKPWHSGGRLCVCRTCSCVQKVIDKTWQSEVDKIYDAYTIYHQSGGIEQSVFETASGGASSRSARLVERLETHIQLPETGRLLDVGCGNGALLRTFSRLSPRWSLVGTELSDKYRTVVEEIDGVEKLYTCAPGQVPGTFDLITMIHVLEHIPSPKEFLTQFGSKLEPDGLLVIEVPNYLQNPFDLLIADHSTHFNISAIAQLLENTGYEVVSIATDWVPKELTIVARPYKNRNQHNETVSRKQAFQKTHARMSISDIFDSTIKSLEWLGSIVETAQKISGMGSFGIFGTSIAATWLFNELSESASFFVDEDIHRAGKTYMNCPICHPRDVPSGSHVFIALPSQIAESIQKRLRKFEGTYHAPPTFHFE